ncbi:MAG: DUF308 domain-containing protein [Ruminococcus sp.]|nr:DUF308 domain-containing protein [Ruminococcus sp.]
MEFIKKMFRNYWVLSVFCIVLGLAMIIEPGLITGAIGKTVGGLLIAYGAAQLVRYFVTAHEDPAAATGLVSGVLLAAAGIFIFIKPDFIPKVIAIFFGLFMMISGICNVQDAFSVRKLNPYMWKSSIIPASITTVIGILLLINPLLSWSWGLRLMGITLLISGVSNVVGCFNASRNLKKLRRAAAAGRSRQGGKGQPGTALSLRESMQQYSLKPYDDPDDYIDL